MSEVPEGAFFAWGEFSKKLEGYDPERVSEMLQEHQSALDALVLASRHTQVLAGVDWFEPASIPELQTCMAFAQHASLAARHALTVKNPGRATDLILASMQFGRDLMHSPSTVNQMIGSMVLRVHGGDRRPLK